MKALVYTGSNQLELQAWKEPVPAAGEVKIKVYYCGICGSDVHGYLGKTGRRTPPMVMGHEFSGIVTETGEGVNGISVGTPVTVEPLLFCSKCTACKEGLTNMCEDKTFLGVFEKNGGLMEYICVPQQYVIPLPTSVPLEYGAVIEPLAVGYRGAKQAGNLQGRNVLIIGAGTIGLMTLMFVLRQDPNCVVVSDLSDERLAIAKVLGAKTLNPGKQKAHEVLIAAFGVGQADVTIEAVGIEPTTRQSIELLKNGGTAVWIGNSAKVVEVPMQEIVTRELRIQGTNVYTMNEFQEITKMLKNEYLGLDKLISTICTMEEAPSYFDKLSHDPGALIKVLVKVSEDEVFEKNKN